MSTEADYVVIGGGSAGAVLASRLSENSNTSVILVEAGGEADAFMVKMPAGFARMLNDPRYDWCYVQDSDPSIMNRHFVWSAGKMLGGGSSINGQVYIRGTRADYQRWVESGCVGWSFDDCLPFFMKSENYFGAANKFHGKGGPLSVVEGRDPHPLCKTFIKSCEESHIKPLPDYSDGNMDGAFMTLATQFQNGTRCGTAHSFLPAARQRPNLEVLTHAQAERITFEGKRATGVQVKRNGELITIKARREVIVCTGTVASPALLMRSGIGQGNHLTSHGIEVVADRSQVGQNLQEHAGIALNKFVNVPTYNSQMSAAHNMMHALKYFLLKKGPMVTPAVQAMALARTRPDLADPDVQLHFLPLSYDIDPETTCASTGFMPKEPTVMISATTCQPKSRGKILLRSNSANDMPQISHQLLGDKRDVETLIGACKLIESIFSVHAWKEIITGPRKPWPAPKDYTEWESYVRSKSMMGYHPVGTCRMGSDPDAVVDTSLRVNGVNGLRVADASVMPFVTSANTNATAMMIGERAAEFIGKAA